MEPHNWYAMGSNFKIVTRLVECQKVRRSFGNASTRNDVLIHMLDCIPKVGDCLGLRLRKLSEGPINGRSVLLGSKSSESSKRALCSVNTIIKVANTLDERLDTAARCHVFSNPATPGDVLSRGLVCRDHVRREQSGRTWRRLNFPGMEDHAEFQLIPERCSTGGKLGWFEMLEVRHCRFLMPNVRAKRETTAWRAGHQAQNGPQAQRLMASAPCRWRSA